MQNEPKPIWWKTICFVTLCACMGWPIVWFGSIFVFDNPPEGDYYRLLCIVGIIDSYPLWIMPLNYLVLWVYRRSGYRTVALSIYLLPVVALVGTNRYFQHALLPTYMYTDTDSRLFALTPAAKLSEAIQRDDTVSIESILTVDPELVHYTEEHHKMSMLHYAYKRENFASVRQLIRQGADINEYDANGNTLLTKLCGGRLDWDTNTDYFTPEDTTMIAWLLANGADVNLPTIERGQWSIPDYTPIQYLCFFGPDSPEMLELLLRYGANPMVRRIDHENHEVSTLRDACWKQHYRMALILMDAGVPCDSTLSNYLHPINESDPFYHPSAQEIADREAAWQRYLKLTRTGESHD